MTKAKASGALAIAAPHQAVAVTQADYDAYRGAKGKPRRDVAMIGDAELADFAAAAAVPSDQDAA